MIKKDQIVLASSGNYSDFNVDGIYKALKDFDTKEQIANFLSENPMEKPKYKWLKLDLCWDDPKFMDFFVKNGLVERVPYVEIHQDSYSYCMTPEKIIVSEND